MAAASAVVENAAFGQGGGGPVIFPTGLVTLPHVPLMFAAGPVTLPAGPLTFTAASAATAAGVVGAGLSFLPFTATGRYRFLGQLGAAIHLRLPAVGLPALLIGATQAVAQAGETGADAIAQILPGAVRHSFAGCLLQFLLELLPQVVAGNEEAAGVVGQLVPVVHFQGDADAFHPDAVPGLEGAGHGDADDTAEHVEGDDPPEEAEDVQVGDAGASAPGAQHDERVEDTVEHAEAEEEDAAEEGGDDFADDFAGAHLHAGHEGDGGAGDDGHEHGFEVWGEGGEVFPVVNEDVVGVGEGGGGGPHDDESADEVAEEGVEPEPHQLEDAGAPGDDGGGGDEEAFGEQFRVGEEEGDEAEAEGDTAEELAAAEVGDTHADEDAEADFHAAHDAGDELLGAGTGEALAAFADLPIEGVVEGFFAVEGGVVVVESGDAFFLDALTVFGEAFLDLRALVVGAAVFNSVDDSHEMSTFLGWGELARTLQAGYRGWWSAPQHGDLYPRMVGFSLPG